MRGKQETIDVQGNSGDYAFDTMVISVGYLMTI